MRESSSSSLTFAEIGPSVTYDVHCPSARQLDDKLKTIAPVPTATSYFELPLSKPDDILTFPSLVIYSRQSGLDFTGALLLMFRTHVDLF